MILTYNYIILMNNTITSNYEKLKDFYDNNLNMDKQTFKTSNDEPTPISCVEEMVNKIPNKFWEKDNLKILDHLREWKFYRTIIKISTTSTTDNIGKNIF